MGRDTPAAPVRLQVAVFRALMLGDLLCATPALRALRLGLPDAHITLVGLPWTAALAERLDCIDDFVALPGWPGLPEQAAASDAVRASFVQDMRARRFDLAVQLHGSGQVANQLIADWRPRRQAGFGQQAAGPDDGLFIGWPRTGSEIERLLSLTDHLGMPRDGVQLDFPLRAGDLADARALRAGHMAQQGGHGCAHYVIVHPGSQWPSRRWPADRFAAVADSLAAQGLAVVITGTEQELQIGRAVADTMRHPALLLSGRTTLWTLGALVSEAQLVVCNDTGISHVAAALRTPTVVVANGSEVARWAPLDAVRHRVLWQQVACRPCSNIECPEVRPCALGVHADAVQRVALQALERHPRATHAQPTSNPMNNQ